MARTGEELTAADWRLRLAQPIAESVVPPVSQVAFAREFRAITQRVRRLHQSTQLQLAEEFSLQPAWRHVLELLQLLTELQSVTPTSSATLDLLAATDRALQRLEAHLALCEFTTATAERLHPIVDEIVYGSEWSSRRLLNVAAELVANLDETASGPCLTPEPLFSTAAVLERAGWSRADWFAQSVTCAQLAAAVTRQQGVDRDQRRWVVAAALVQDIGSWHQPYRYRHQSVVQGGRHRAEPNHPATGAAILNGLVDASVVLGLLVGAHHERVDGTGFPQRLAGHRLTSGQQCLGLMVRLTELLIDPLTGQLAVDHDEPLETAVGLRLWREVRRGGFQEPLAQLALETLRLGLTDEIRSLFPQRIRRLVDVAHQLPAPLSEKAKSRREADEASKSVINPPVFLRRQRPRGYRAVRRGRDW